MIGVKAIYGSENLNVKMIDDLLLVLLQKHRLNGLKR